MDPKDTEAKRGISLNIETFRSPVEEKERNETEVERKEPNETDSTGDNCVFSFGKGEVEQEKDEADLSTVFPLPDDGGEEGKERQFWIELTEEDSDEGKDNMVVRKTQSVPLSFIKESGESSADLPFSPPSSTTIQEKRAKEEAFPTTSGLYFTPRDLQSPPHTFTIPSSNSPAFRPVAKDKVYTPGSLLCGVVRMACAKPLFLTNVTVTFSCIEMVSVQNAIDEDEQVTEHINYNHSIIIYEKETLFEPGNYSFPFKWKIPQSPTSSLPSPTGFGFFEVFCFYSHSSCPCPFPFRFPFRSFILLRPMRRAASSLPFTLSCPLLCSVPLREGTTPKGPSVMFLLRCGQGRQLTSQERWWSST
jgi:hypothetical protein